MFRNRKALKKASSTSADTAAATSSSAAAAAAAASSHSNGHSSATKSGMEPASNGSGPASSSGAAPSLQRMRSRSAPPSSRRRDLIDSVLIEEHYRVDPGPHHTVLPGAIKYDDDWARDVHDFFNLIVLVPICVLNGMNWNWDLLLSCVSFSAEDGGQHSKSAKAAAASADVGNVISSAWTGEWFDLFFQLTALYFLADLIWVWVVPQCVKSPATIIQHHIATLLYILIPYKYPFVRWLMGACMSVELNTWFLIARRVFNKQGLPAWILSLPWGLSIRIKMISVLFYSTWIGIRCIIYPAIWFRLFSMWKDYSVEVDTKLNVLAIALPLHTVFCGLNLKWTLDLLLSKMRYWKKGGGQKVDKGL